MSIIGNPLWILGRGGSAIIHVQAFTGSTITIEKNSIVIAILQPGEGIVNPDVSGASDWYYYVAHRDFGTLDITATYNGADKVGSVNVTDEIQYDIIMPTQRLWMYQSGDAYGYTWDTNFTASSCTFSVKDGNNRLNLYASGGNYAHAAIHTTFDLTNYVTFGARIGSRNDTANRNYIYAGETQWDHTFHMTSSNVGAISKDITELVGEHYIGLYTWYNHRFSVSQLYLDP